jgi:cytochrome P450
LPSPARTLGPAAPAIKGADRTCAAERAATTVRIAPAPAAHAMTDVAETTPPFLDLADPAFAIDSEQVQRLRARSWYARTNYGLAVLRYDEVNRLLKDRRLRQGSGIWPALNGVTSGPFADWWGKTLLNLEGDDHRRLRRLLNPAFAPGVIAPMVPRFRELAVELIDGFAAQGRCELMRDFAEPYATRVMAIMLGIAEAEWRTLADWSADLGLGLAVTVAQDLPRVEAALEGLYGYADALIAERERAPADDFVTRLVQAHFDDDRLSHDELRVSIVLLIFGGIDTTRNQLGLAVQTFVEHPEQWALLGARPELAGAAVEEVMRVNPTITWVTREALEDLSFNGLAIPRGTTIHLLSQAAGTDPRAVPAPAFDITAERPRHFGFGGGAHHCIGHFIARSDMAEALPLLAARLRAPRIDGAARWLPRSGNTGPIELPLAFDPA